MLMFSENLAGYDYYLYLILAYTLQMREMNLKDLSPQ